MWFGTNNDGVIADVRAAYTLAGIDSENDLDITDEKIILVSQLTIDYMIYHHFYDYLPHDDYNVDSDYDVNYALIHQIAEILTKSYDLDLETALDFSTIDPHYVYGMMMANF